MLEAFRRRVWETRQRWPRLGLPYTQPSSKYPNDVSVVVLPVPTQGSDGYTLYVQVFKGAVQRGDSVRSAPLEIPSYHVHNLPQWGDRISRYRVELDANTLKVIGVAKSDLLEVTRLISNELRGMQHRPNGDVNVWLAEDRYDAFYASRYVPFRRMLRASEQVLLDGFIELARTLDARYWKVHIPSLSELKRTWRTKQELKFSLLNRAHKNAKDLHITLTITSKHVKITGTYFQTSIVSVSKSPHDGLWECHVGSPHWQDHDIKHRAGMSSAEALSWLRAVVEKYEGLFKLPEHQDYVKNAAWEYNWQLAKEAKAKIPREQSKRGTVAAQRRRHKHGRGKGSPKVTRR